MFGRRPEPWHARTLNTSGCPPSGINITSPNRASTQPVSSPEDARRRDSGTKASVDTGSYQPINTSSPKKSSDWRRERRTETTNHHRSARGGRSRNRAPSSGPSAQGMPSPLPRSPVPPPNALETSPDNKTLHQAYGRRTTPRPRPTSKQAPRSLANYAPRPSLPKRRSKQHPPRPTVTHLALLALRAPNGALHRQVPLRRRLVGRRRSGARGLLPTRPTRKKTATTGSRVNLAAMDYSDNA